VLREGAGHNGIDPAIQVAGDILEGLAGADGAFAEDGIAAELLNGKLEIDLSEIACESGTEFSRR
jgi:hypothetical protein